MAFWLGIDVAKATLELASSESEATWQVPNTPDGWQAVTARYAEAPPVGVVMEATGTLHVGLHLHLCAAGWHSSVMNPKWIADYAGAAAAWARPTASMPGCWPATAGRKRRPRRRRNRPHSAA